MNKVKLGEVIQFNPSESIKKGTIAKKIAMEKLQVYTKKISGFENTEYSAGPKFRNNDTLLAKITPCLENGKTAFVDILDENEIAFGSSEFIVLRATENITDANYIYYLARSPKFRNRAIGCMEGTSGRKRVNDKTLQNEEILLPNLATQTAIARVLSSLDDKIELNNKINKELENLARTIYEYWFVQNAEESWERKKIGDLGELKNGANYEKANLVGKKVKIVNVRNISSSSIYIGVENLDEIILPKNEIDKYLLDENDILFARSGIPGAVRLIEKTSENVIFCGFAIRFRLNDKSLKNYLFFPLKRNEEFAKNKSGGSIMPNISQDVLKDIFVSIPPTELLEKFNKTISPIFSQIIKNHQENAELAQLRDFLLPLLMNGQVTVVQKLTINGLKKFLTKKEIPTCV